MVAHCLTTVVFSGALLIIINWSHEESCSKLLHNYCCMPHNTEKKISTFYWNKSLFLVRNFRIRKLLDLQSRVVSIFCILMHSISFNDFFFWNAKRNIVLTRIYVRICTIFGVVWIFSGTTQFQRTVSSA